VSIEEQLRATFREQEQHVPRPELLAPRIDRGARRLRRRRTRQRMALAAVALLALVGAVPEVLHHWPRSERSTSAAGLPEPAPVAVPAGAIDLLLVITDTPDGATRPELATATVIRIPAGHSGAFLVSVDRDQSVATADDPGATLASAYQSGGGEQLGAETAGLLGLRGFTLTISLSYTGVQLLVDAVGDVRFCIDHTMVSSRLTSMDPDPVTGVVSPGKVGYAAGCNSYPGADVVDLLRERVQIDKAVDVKAAADKNTRDFLIALLGRLNQQNSKQLGLLGTVVAPELTVQPKPLAAWDWWGLAALAGGIQGLQYPARAADADALRSALATDTLAQYLAAHPG